MSEQFANLASTTLASGYTAGSGSISVVSASGWPASGTFTLVIRDPTTKAIKLLFRVTSVSGTTFTGASEGADASANAGDLVDGTMVTVASLAQFKTDVLAAVPPAPVSGFVPFWTLTPPVPASFTNFNFNGTGATTTKDTTGNILSIRQQGSSTSGQIAGVTKSKINALFTVTVGFAAAAGPFQDNQAGVCLTDGTKFVVFALQWFGNQQYMNVSVYNSATSFSVDRFAIQGLFLFGPLVFMRIQETVSARIFSLSPDLKTWVVWRNADSNTDWQTTTGYGVFVRGDSAQSDTAIAVYHFAESTP